MPAIDLTKLDQAKLDRLAVTYTNDFGVTETQRQQAKETEWLQSLRACKGKHDPEVLAEFGTNDSQIYSQYTRSKEVPLRAKLNQHLIPEKEKNWEVKPTPKPSVDDAQLQEIINPLVQLNEDRSFKSYPSEEEIDQAIKRFSDDRAARMSVKIDDQLTEGKYKLKQKAQIKSTIRYGTGVIKGPLVESYEVNETEFVPATGVAVKIRDFLRQMFTGGSQPTGTWKQKKVTKYRPIPEKVNLWRWYPDMTAAELSQCDFVFELHPKSKHEMRGLAKRSDFFGDVINKILEEKPEGNYKLRPWEQELQTVPDGAQPIIDTKSYQVIERNGYIDGQALLEAGVIDDPDVKLEHFVSFWFCDGQCIKISPWPEEFITSLTDYYHVFYYEKDETSIFGTGLPAIIRDRQLAMNSGERNMLGHAAWLKAPCGEINISLLHPDSYANAQAFGPGTFLGKNAPGNDAAKAILSLYHIEDHMSSYIALMNFQRSQGDYEASLPSGLFGAPTRSDETAKGVAVRFENLLDFIKDLARNFDDANTSFIKSVYRWNMAFGDPENKGDLAINAVGTANALIRDAIRESIAFFMQSMPEEMKARFKWSEFAKELCKSMFDDPDKFVYTDAEFDAMQAPMQEKQAEMDALQKELAMVKGRYDQAKADNMLAKAQKILAEINHDLESKTLGLEKDKVDITRQNIENLMGQIEAARMMRGDDDKDRSGSKPAEK